MATNTGVSLTPSFAKRVGRVVKRVERESLVSPSGKRRRSTEPTQALTIRGKLDGPLNKDGSATLSVWYWNGTAEADSGHDVTVWDWLLKTGQSIASGKKVAASFCGGRYYVLNAECP